MASLINGRESEQASRVGDGKGSLVCCSPWGCKESDTTERLNWIELRRHCFLLHFVIIRGLNCCLRAWPVWCWWPHQALLPRCWDLSGSSGIVSPREMLCCLLTDGVPLMFCPLGLSSGPLSLVCDQPRGCSLILSLCLDRVDWRHCLSLLKIRNSVQLPLLRSHSLIS